MATEKPSLHGRAASPDDFPLSTFWLGFFSENTVGWVRGISMMQYGAFYSQG